MIFSETAKKNDENLKKRLSEFTRSKRVIHSERWGSLVGAKVEGENYKLQMTVFEKHSSLGNRS